MYLLGPKIEQIHKLRAVLGDFQSTPGRIKCPLLPQCPTCSRIGGNVVPTCPSCGKVGGKVGKLCKSCRGAEIKLKGDMCQYCPDSEIRLWKMKNYLFQRRVAKLKRLEKQVKQIFERDMLKTYEVYKNAQTEDA